MISLTINSKNWHDKPVLQNVNMNIKNGERIAILGTSGIGKTTLLKILSRLDRKFDGHISGNPSIALMFQNPNLIEWRNIGQNLKIFHPLLDNDRIHKALTYVGLIDKISLYPRQLSLGQQRRLALLRTFLTPKNLVLLDEPFASLDSKTSGEMIALTNRFLDNSNSACIIVTHSEDEAHAMATRIIRLEGNPATIL